MRAMKVILVAAAGLVYAAGGAAAEPAKPTNPAKPAPGKSDQVCFAEKTTGSHLRRRVCMTREEQEQRRLADQQAMERLRRSRGAGGFGKPDPSL